MLRLNNKGWGLPMMLALLGVLMGALLVVVITSSKFSPLLGSTTETNHYEVNRNSIEPLPNEGLETNDDRKFYEYEQIITDAASIYKDIYYPDMNDDVKFYINIDNLDISETITSSCSGYAKITNDSEMPFIKCGDYQTEGYLKELDN